MISCAAALVAGAAVSRGGRITCSQRHRLGGAGRRAAAGADWELRPLIAAGLRLGEGTGAVAAVSLLDLALAAL